LRPRHQQQQRLPYSKLGSPTLVRDHKLFAALVRRIDALDRSYRD
jgi:hypothetical protein